MAADTLCVCPVPVGFGFADLEIIIRRTNTSQRVAHMGLTRQIGSTFTRSFMCQSHNACVPVLNVISM